MLPIVTLGISLAGLILATGALVLQLRQLRRLKQRLEELNQAVQVVSVTQEQAERRLLRTEESTQQAVPALSELKSRLDELEQRFLDVESYAGVCVPPRPVASGLNINRRVEAVRLLQDGASEEHVSSELGIALSEVRLIAHLERPSAPPVKKRRTRVA